MPHIEEQRCYTLKMADKEQTAIHCYRCSDPMVSGGLSLYYSSLNSQIEINLYCYVSIDLNREGLGRKIQEWYHHHLETQKLLLSYGLLTCRLICVVIFMLPGSTKNFAHKMYWLKLTKTWWWNEIPASIVVTKHPRVSQQVIATVALVGNSATSKEVLSGVNAIF